MGRVLKITLCILAATAAALADIPESSAKKAQTDRILKLLSEMNNVDFKKIDAARFERQFDLRIQRHPPKDTSNFRAD